MKSCEVLDKPGVHSQELKATSQNKIILAILEGEVNVSQKGTDPVEAAVCACFVTSSGATSKDTAIPTLAVDYLHISKVNILSSGLSKQVKSTHLELIYLTSKSKLHGRKYSPLEQAAQLPCAIHLCFETRGSKVVFSTNRS